MKPKILLLSDGQNWIVDRIAEKYKSLIPYDITIDYYTKIPVAELYKVAEAYDIIHFNNSDVGGHKEFIKTTTKPVIVSVRSFRYSHAFLDIEKYVVTHVIHPNLKSHFKNARFISDAVDDLFQPKDFVVGMAYQNAPWNIDYKGVDLVKKACEELGVVFKPCFDLPIEDMPAYYASIDLYVCASINEGFGTPVMECLMLNKPVISTDVGMGKFTNIFKIERTVESIKEGILYYYTYPQVAKFRWGVTCNALAELYLELYDHKK